MSQPPETGKNPRPSNDRRGRDTELYYKDHAPRGHASSIGGRELSGKIKVDALLAAPDKLPPP